MEEISRVSFCSMTGKRKSKSPIKNWPTIARNSQWSPAIQMCINLRGFLQSLPPRFTQLTVQVYSEHVPHAAARQLNRRRSICVRGRPSHRKYRVRVLKLPPCVQRPCWLPCSWPGLPWACCDCGCVWDFFLEAHLSLLLFLFSVGLVWGGSSFVVRYLRSSEQGRLCGFCCWQMLFALLLHEFSVLKTRQRES